MDRRNLCKIGLAGLGTMAFSRTVGAMKYVTKASAKKKWAIVYYTQCGASRDAATWINEGLGDIADVIEVKNNPKVGDYEGFIIGGGIYAGKINDSLANFVKNNKDALKEKIKGLYVVCGNEGKATPSATTDGYLTNQLVTPLGVSDKPGKVFFGRSTPSCGGLNYDNMKKPDAVAFGQQILTTAIKSLRHGLSQYYELYHCYNNGKNSAITIKYNLPRSSDVLLTICSLDGRTLATLVSGRQRAGSYEIPWSAGKFSQGFYLYRLEAGSFTATRRAMVIS